MNIPDISAGAPAPATLVKIAGDPASETSVVPFSDLVSQLLQSTEQEQDSVGDELQRLISGETSNIHEVSLAVARADLSLRLMLEVRDQLIGTYREIMRMQV